MPLYSWDRSWLKAREIAESAICLLTIHHDMIETFRIANNTVDIVSRGDTFRRCLFDLDIINDNDQPPRAVLSMQNVADVGRIIGFELKKLVGPAELTIEVVSSAHLDEPIYRAARLELKNINITPQTISGELSRQDYGTEVCGTIRVVPSKFPALFRIN